MSYMNMIGQNDTFQTNDKDIVALMLETGNLEVNKKVRVST